MNDPYSKSYCLAYDEVLEGVLCALMKKGILTAPELRDLLERSANNLLSKKTEVGAAATEHIRRLGVALGVAPGKT